MIIREVRAEIIKDSRDCNTISVSVNGCRDASSPNGKSTGDYETKPYYRSLKFCVDFLNNSNFKIEINKFEDLIKVEKAICKGLNLKKASNFGANALYAFESAILKALASEKGKELFEIVSSGSHKIPFPVGNVVGGGLHSSSLDKRPDFQEFLVIPKSMKFYYNFKAMKYIYSLIKKDLKSSRVNDEGAWLVSLKNEEVFDLLNKRRFIAEKKFNIKINWGIDAATSSFFKNGKYNYLGGRLNSIQQLAFMESIVVNDQLEYLEDPFQQRDFSNFSKLLKKTGKECMIVGDDLTATQYERVINAIKKKSINSMIIKPNQNGSLIELSKIFKLCKNNGIKTVMSHRSGETMDDALSDYAVGFGADYIKCGVATKWRDVKLKRLIEISKKL